MDAGFEDGIGFLGEGERLTTGYSGEVQVVKA
jgi:hypothetical protein